jgi:protein SCO1/2
MFYATCPFASPTLISDIKRLDRKLDAKARQEMRVLLVTFDPERDTPEKLGQLAKTHQVDTKRWTFARASKDDTRDLANVLGLKYRQLPSGQFNHSSVITVVDEKGMIRARVEGLQSPNTELISTLQRLAGGRGQ